MKNGYPSNFVGICIKTFLNGLFIDKRIYEWPSKNEVICLLPFTDKKSNITICFFAISKLFFIQLVNSKQYLVLKIFLMKKLLCNVVYCCTCSNYNFTYYGKTSRYFFSSAAKHMCFSNLIDKYTRNVKEFVIFSDHLLQCYC